MSVLGARVRFAPPAQVPGGASDPSAKLAQVAKRLKKTAKASTDPTLAQGEWFVFDCEMTYGTARIPHHQRSVVLFFPPTALEAEGVALAEGIVLFGTASHLMGQAPETYTGQALSTVNWLASMLDTQDRENAYWRRHPRGRT